MPSTGLGSFNCTRNLGGRKVAGNFSGYVSSLWFEDWHEYGQEPLAFADESPYPKDSYFDAASSTIANTTFEDSDGLFEIRGIE